MGGREASVGLFEISKSVNTVLSQASKSRGFSSPININILIGYVTGSIAATSSVAGGI